MKYQVNFRAKSMISSHVKCLLTSQVKRSLLLWLHSKIALIIVYHVYNCFIFHWCYTINSILHGRWEMRNSSSTVEKNFTHALRLLVKYFSTLEEKSRSSVSHVISSIYLLITVNNNFEPWVCCRWGGKRYALVLSIHLYIFKLQQKKK